MCHYMFTFVKRVLVMLSVNMLNVALLNVIMLSVVMLNVIMLSVLAPLLRLLIKM